MIELPWSLDEKTKSKSKRDQLDTKHVDLLTGEIETYWGDRARLWYLSE